MIKHNALTYHHRLLNGCWLVREEIDIVVDCNNFVVVVDCNSFVEAVDCNSFVGVVDCSIVDYIVDCIAGVVDIDFCYVMRHYHNWDSLGMMMDQHLLGIWRLPNVVQQHFRPLQQRTRLTVKTFNYD